MSEDWPTVTELVAQEAELQHDGFDEDVAWAFGSAASSGAMYRAGKVRYIAVAAPKSVAGFESIPTVAEADVDLVFDPPWNHSMMSEAARLETGML